MLSCLPCPAPPVVVQTMGQVYAKKECARALGVLGSDYCGAHAAALQAPYLGRSVTQLKKYLAVRAGSGVGRLCVDRVSGRCEKLRGVEWLHHEVVCSCRVAEWLREVAGRDSRVECGTRCGRTSAAGAAFAIHTFHPHQTRSGQGGHER
eukprot:355609-Chlamydomonas_euryale.AAC.1